MSMIKARGCYRPPATIGATGLALSRIVAAMAVLLAPLPAVADAAGSVPGRWLTPSKHGVVEIERCGASICGTLIDSDGLKAEPGKTDSLNKDPALRNRLLKGLRMLQGFTPTATGWAGGTIYNPEDGGTYHATITLTGPDTLALKGCIFWPLCKTQTWQRIH